MPGRSYTSAITLAFGARLRFLRDECGLSMQGLARASHISAATICYAESGLLNPTVETIAKLACGLGVSPMHLMMLSVERCEHERHAETVRALTVPAVRASRKYIEAKHHLLERIP